MVNYERVAEKIFAIIKGHGHTLSMYKEDGMDTTDAAEARRFFVAKPNYMITLDEETSTIKINKNSNLDLEDLEGILKQMKNLARENMLNTQVKVFGKEITPKDFAYQARKFKDANMESITNEASLSRMSGSKKTSYQTLESVKMIVRHRKAVDEDVRGSRSRQIKAIFLEQGGERFRFPHNHLAGARAMARHMYEGGNMQDTIGEYIVESVTNMIKLNEFVRYARSNKLMNEANQDVVKTVKENIATIRGELKGLTGAKSYTRVSEAITAREASVLEEDDTTDLQDMFTVRKFDEKITDTLPLVRRLMNEKQAWRDALIEASQQTIYMTAKEELAEEDIMEFDSPTQQVGYKIGKVAKRMVESGDLSTFVAKVAGKLIEGAKISEFEKTIVRNVMENARIEEETECDNCAGGPYGKGIVDAGGQERDCPVCNDGKKKEDAVESIGDQFELKMKMIEHEEIFTEDERSEQADSHSHDDCKECDGSGNVGDLECGECAGSGIITTRVEEGQCSECGGVGEVWGKACEKCGGEEELEEGFMDSIAKSAGRGIGKLAGKASVAIVDRAVNKMIAAMKGGKSPVAFAAQYSGNQGVIDLFRNWLDRNKDNEDYELVKKMYQMAGGDLNMDLEEGEGDTCIRCRKGTMEVGDTMMGAQERCNRCGYQHAVREDGYDDHHAGEIEAGAHMGMPEDNRPVSAQVADLLAQGERVYSTVSGAMGKVKNVDDHFITVQPPYRQAGVANLDKDHIFVEYNDRAGRYDIVSQKDRDTYSALGESDAEKAGSGNVDPEDFMDDCPDCGGTGKAKDSIFDDAECKKCGGEGYI